VLGAAAELKQVMLNLGLNALEAVDADRGEVRVSVSRNDAVVRVAVEDNGRGMSTETLERVFEPFFTEKRGVHDAGTGLGLSISHAIVDSHGGHLRGESDGPGKGSRFVVELPLTARRAAAAEATA
jgi:signal transduction histidine kinase